MKKKRPGRRPLPEAMDDDIPLDHPNHPCMGDLYPLYPYILHHNQLTFGKFGSGSIFLGWAKLAADGNHEPIIRNKNKVE